MQDLLAGLFAKCTNYGSAIFAAARANDTHALKGLLNKLGESPNKYNGEKRTPLSISLLANSYEATVLLLEHGADPNIVVKRHNDVYEKIPQFDIKLREISNLKLLAMYGATAQGLTFPKGYENEKHIFEESLNKKLFLDTKHSQIMAELQKTTPNQKSIIKLCQEAADIWLDLAKEEQNKVYRKHYFEKALVLYQQAISYIHYLSKQAIQLDSKHYSQLFETIADISSALNLVNKAAEHSQMAAKITTIMDDKQQSVTTFFKQARYSTNDQRLPLLAPESSNQVNQHSTRALSFSAHTKID